MHVNSDSEEDDDNRTSSKSSAFRPLPSLPVETGSVPKRRVPLPPPLPEPRSRDNSVNGESERKCGENAVFEDKRNADTSNSSCDSGRERHAQESNESADFLPQTERERNVDRDLAAFHKEPPVTRSRSVPGAYRPAKWPPRGLIRITDEILAKVVLKKTGINISSENHEPAASNVRQHTDDSISSQPIIDVVQADHSATMNGNTDGTFVVRPCQHAGPNSPYVLTVLRRSVVHHVTIRLVSIGKYALGTEKSSASIFNSVAELISFYHNNSLSIKTSHKSPAGSNEVLLTGSPRKL